MTETSRFYFLDLSAQELVVVPALAGVQGEARVVVGMRGAPQPLVLQVVGAGECVRIALSAVAPFASASVKLQRRDDKGWVDVVPYAPLKRLGDLAHDTIDPSEWGIAEDSIAVLRDPRSRDVLMRRSVPAGGGITRTHDASDDRSLLLEFYRPADERLGLGPRVGPSLRWVPTKLRGNAPAHPVQVADGLAYTRRTSVILAPTVLRRAGHNALVTEGFLGAWSNGEPIVEAMDFVLGRQEMLFQPTAPEPTQIRSGTAIYLGRPHSSWGHFLTQGLARVWFALQHPELPVVWDSRRALPSHQQHVLDMLGVRNEQHYLTRAVGWDEIIFPFPGVCIGDFVQPGYTRSVGRVPAARRVPGKRLFLSRSGTSNFPGGDEGELDALAERYGFSVMHPEQHSIEDQLAEISSAEVVMAVEGSSLHTPLLLRDPVETNFWALSRHRRGSGLFEHVKAAKGLNYETLNFLRSRTRSARDPIDIDLDAVDKVLRMTDGLTRNLELVEPYLERPSRSQTSFEAHLRNAQVRSGRWETDLHRARLALAAGDLRAANDLLASI